MQMKPMLAVVALLGFSMWSSASAQCTLKYPSKVPYDPAHEPARLLRGKIEIRQFQHLDAFLTHQPKTKTLVKRGTSLDCRPVTVFPECSELEIVSNGSAASMTLKDTESSPPTAVITSLPLHLSGANVDYLYSDELPLDGKKYALYVYLLNDHPSAGKIMKHYMLEAFDVDDKKCEQFRPDKHPDQIANVNPARKAATGKKSKMRPWWETDTTQGHEGHN